MSTEWFESNCADMLRWFKEERAGKSTSFCMMCRKFCMMRDMVKVRDHLVKTGKLRKLKTGYRL